MGHILKSSDSSDLVPTLDSLGPGSGDPVGTKKTWNRWCPRRLTGLELGLGLTVGPGAGGCGPGRQVGGRPPVTHVSSLEHPARVPVHLFPEEGSHGYGVGRG